MVVYCWAVSVNSHVAIIWFIAFCWARSCLPLPSSAELFSPAGALVKLLVLHSPQRGWHGFRELWSPWTVGHAVLHLDSVFHPSARLNTQCTLCLRISVFTCFPGKTNLAAFLSGLTLMCRIHKALEEDRLTSECWLPCFLARGACTSSFFPLSLSFLFGKMEIIGRIALIIMSLWDLNKEIEVLVQEHQEGSGVGPSLVVGHNQAPGWRTLKWNHPGGIQALGKCWWNTRTPWIWLQLILVSDSRRETGRGKKRETSLARNK